MTSNTRAKYPIPALLSRDIIRKEHLKTLKTVLVSALTVKGLPWSTSALGEVFRFCAEHDQVCDWFQIPFQYLVDNLLSTPFRPPSLFAVGDCFIEEFHPFLGIIDEIIQNPVRHSHDTVIKGIAQCFCSSQQVLFQFERHCLLCGIDFLLQNVSFLRQVETAELVLNMISSEELRQSTIGYKRREDLETSLHLAASQNHFGFAAYLLGIIGPEHPMLIDTNRKGETVLMKAASVSALRITKLILGTVKNSNPEFLDMMLRQKSYQKQTALQYAIKSSNHNSRKCAQMIISYYGLLTHH